ncbi:MAG: hypothetical protein KAJ14_00845, partial [Candidatus Omnitrophica bacterium]|nr:hypothetical protein [Candidatus Omnitrophota bacterium]
GLPHALGKLDIPLSLIKVPGETAAIMPEAAWDALPFPFYPDKPKIVWSRENRKQFGTSVTGYFYHSFFDRKQRRKELISEILTREIEENNLRFGSVQDGGIETEDDEKVKAVSDKLFKAWDKIARIGDLNTIRRMNKFEYAKQLGIKEIKYEQAAVALAAVFNETTIFCLSKSLWEYFRTIIQNGGYGKWLANSLVCGDIFSVIIVLAFLKEINGPGSYYSRVGIHTFERRYTINLGKYIFTHEFFECELKEADSSEKLSESRRFICHQNIKVIEEELRFALLMGEDEFNNALALRNKEYEELTPEQKNKVPSRYLDLLRKVQTTEFEEETYEFWAKLCGDDEFDGGYYDNTSIMESIFEAFTMLTILVKNIGFSLEGKIFLDLGSGYGGPSIYAAMNPDSKYGEPALVILEDIVRKIDRVMPGKYEEIITNFKDGGEYKIKTVEFIDGKKVIIFGVTHGTLFDNISKLLSGSMHSNLKAIIESSGILGIEKYFYSNNVVPKGNYRSYMIDMKLRREWIAIALKIKENVSNDFCFGRIWMAEEAKICLKIKEIIEDMSGEEKLPINEESWEI